MEETEFSKAVKEEFLATAREIFRPGIAELMKFIDKGGFYEAPASTRFHGNYPGGLARHSLNVCQQLRNLNAFYHFGFYPESMYIVSLFHDLCKMDCYKEELRWRKDSDNQWEQYPVYTFDEDFSYGGHGSKSVFLVQQFITLSYEEAAAINCHMGFSDRAPGDFSLGKVYEKNKLAWALHVADEAATYIDEVEA